MKDKNGRRLLVGNWVKTGKKNPLSLHPKFGKIVYKKVKQYPYGGGKSYAALPLQKRDGHALLLGKDLVKISEEEAMMLIMKS